MINIASNGHRKAYGIKHYNLDTVEDLKDLNPRKMVVGTTAFIIDTSQYYMVNGSYEWKEINPHSGSGGSSNVPGDDDEVIYDGGGIEDSETPSDENIYEGGGV